MGTVSFVPELDWAPNSSVERGKVGAVATSLCDAHQSSFPLSVLWQTWISQLVSQPSFTLTFVSPLKPIRLLAGVMDHSQTLQHFLLSIVYRTLCYDLFYHWGGGQSQLSQQTRSHMYYWTWHFLSICSHFHHLLPPEISVIAGMLLVLQFWWVPVRAPLPLDKRQNQDSSTGWRVLYVA